MYSMGVSLDGRTRYPLATQYRMLILFIVNMKTRLDRPPVMNQSIVHIASHCQLRLYSMGRGPKNKVVHEIPTGASVTSRPDRSTNCRTACDIGAPLVDPQSTKTVLVLSNGPAKA